MSHPPSAEGIVLVDFDGTLFPWGSLDVDHPPFDGAVAAMHVLKNEGYRLGIFTSRLSATWHKAEGRDPLEGMEAQTKIIRRALEAWTIPFDFITAEKIPAVLYLDDKAMRVNEERDLLSAVVAFLEKGDAAL
jgi:hypothetical protein